MMRELRAIAAWAIVLVSQYSCKVVLGLVSLTVVNSRSVLFLKSYLFYRGCFSDSSSGTFDGAYRCDVAWEEEAEQLQALLSLLRLTEGMEEVFEIFLAPPLWKERKASAKEN